MKGIRGRIERNVLLSKCTWLGVGGVADSIFYPFDEQDLSHFLQRNSDLSCTLLGLGSNVLVRDGGIPGIVIHLGKSFRTVFFEGKEVELGAGLLDRNAAQHCQNAGLSGFEFLYTIPGTLGGGLAMNAGCYSGEIADRLLWAWVMDPLGNKHKLSCQELGYSYRRCFLPPGWIFLGGRFCGVEGSKDSIANTMAEFARRRNSTQPMQVKTGGSTFANPAGHSAWQLLDQAGYRGRRKGGALFSVQHCNFLVNTGESTAADLEDLGEEARQEVLAQTGISLEWEIVRLGVRSNNERPARLQACERPL